MFTEQMHSLLFHALSLAMLEKMQVLQWERLETYKFVQFWKVFVTFVFVNVTFSSLFFFNQ